LFNLFNGIRIASEWECYKLFLSPSKMVGQNKLGRLAKQFSSKDLITIKSTILDLPDKTCHKKRARLIFSLQSITDEKKFYKIDTDSLLFSHFLAIDWFSWLINDFHFNSKIVLLPLSKISWTILHWQLFFWAARNMTKSYLRTCASLSLTVTT